MVSVQIMGGLGNNLFQIATVYAYSLKHGVDYCIPLTNAIPHYKGQKPYIFPGIKYCDNIPGLPVYKEKAFTYDEIPFMDNVCFSGYFQSWKYFNDYREEVLKALGFEWEMKSGWVSIHYRLGDYLKLPDFHTIVSMEYISKAITYFIQRGYKNFTVFSDGMDYCIENINIEKHPGCNFEYSEGRTELEDLKYMSCHENNIICNSTFSWWGQYLNKNQNKMVAAPQKNNWFGSSLRHNVDDLYVKNWGLI